MYSCISMRLSAQDQDQEVKEAAIGAMAALVAELGDVLGAEVRGTCGQRHLVPDACCSVYHA
jgi:hypothetical protein